MQTVDEQKVIGGKKVNGHKAHCTCQICTNMINKAKRGGYTDDLNKQNEGKSNKPNQHRKNCKCAICKNMESTKGRRKHRTRKSNGHKPNCKCPICGNMRRGKTRRR